MSIITRGIRGIRTSWQEDGLRGIGWLVRTTFIKIRCRSVVHRMTALRAEENERYAAAFPGTLPDADTAREQSSRAFHAAVSFLIPTYNTRPDLLRALADSLTAQTCGRWEACFYDGASPKDETREALRAIAAEDPRIRVTFGSENLGISGNTNLALAMAEGDVCALVDHDDLLAPDAVYWLLDAYERGADMIYSDEDKCTEDGGRFFDPHLKPDFSPDSLRAGNYVCHLLALDAKLMRSLGGLRPACDGSQDHDLALRASEKAKRVVHIPRVLYHWRMLNTSYSHQGAARCAEAARRATADQLERLGLPAEVTTYRLNVRIRYRLPEDLRVTLVAEGADGPDDPWLRRLIRRTDVPLQEVLPVPEGSAGEAARQAQGEYLVFVHKGLRPKHRSWLRELAMYAQRPDVACAGGPVIDRRQCYLHCGYAVDVPGGALALHLGESRVGPTYQLYDRLVHNVTAVSSALIMIRKDVFLSLGGFGACRTDLRGASLGVRAVRAGLNNVRVPYALMTSDGTVPVLTGPAPADDLARFTAEVGEHPEEKYFAAAFRRTDGSCLIDYDRAGGKP